jgi:hypothetical protein
MTKLRVEGNPLGTGSLTLSAPNTNSDITLNLPSSSGAVPTAATFTATIEGSDGTSDWTQATESDPWIATVAVSGMLATDQPVMDIDMSAVAFADVPDVQSDWALVYRGESDTDELTLYATDEPASDFDVILKVTR